MSQNASADPQEEKAPVLLEDVIVRCRHCGYAGPAEPQAPGKTWLEAVFWIAFLVPGVLYSLWRLFGRRYLCPQCKARDGQVEVPAARRVAVILRAVLLIVFLVAMVVLAIVWNLPRAPAG